MARVRHIPGVYKYIKSARDWKEEVVESKRLSSQRPSNPPLATLPAAKRQALLLWFVIEFYEDGLLVNWLRSPKYTRDMQELVRKNALQIKRERIIGTRMGTVLYLTDLGNKMVQSSKFKQSEKDWIIQSFNSHSLR